MSDTDPEDVEVNNIADAEATRKRHRRVQSKARREENERLGFWQTVFSTPVGRREMWGVLESGHAFDERFATSPVGFPSPEATWCEAGEQRLAFRIYRSWMRLCPEGVVLMMQENDPALATPKRTS